MSDSKLDEWIDTDADDKRRMDRFRGTDWGGLSAHEFGRQKAAVFRQVKAVGKQRKLASDVRDLDEEAEAQRRLDAEPRDVKVTFDSR